MTTLSVRGGELNEEPDDGFRDGGIAGGAGVSQPVSTLIKQITDATAGKTDAASKKAVAVANEAAGWPSFRHRRPSIRDFPGGRSR